MYCIIPAAAKTVGIFFCEYSIAKELSYVQEFQKFHFIGASHQVVANMYLQPIIITPQSLSHSTVS